jgi:hypothetical protein
MMNDRALGKYFTWFSQFFGPQASHARDGLVAKWYKERKLTPKQHAKSLIQKLRRLTVKRGATADEARKAQWKARELMGQYGIKETDLLHEVK